MTDPTEIETTYPVLLYQPPPGSAGPAAPTADPTSQTVRTALSNALGWRWRDGDVRGFQAALTASFELHEVEGHVEYKHTPRGFAVQADLGAVTGGQAVLAARARTTIAESQGLLESLRPLDPSADPEECAALRSQVAHWLTELRTELEQPVIRLERVDTILTILTAGTGPNPAAAGDVRGQLGRIRDAFGLDLTRANDVDEERIVTAFSSLVDWVENLRLARAQYLGVDVGDFLGTTMIRLSAEMAAVVEQIDQVTFLLDSLFFTAPQRETVEIDESTHLTLDGLFRWMRDFNASEGNAILSSGGRIALRSAFIPTVARLHGELLSVLSLREPDVLTRPRIVRALQETRDATEAVLDSAKSAAAQDGGPIIETIGSDPTHEQEPRSHLFTIEGTGLAPNPTVRVQGTPVSADRYRTRGVSTLVFSAQVEPARVVEIEVEVGGRIDTGYVLGPAPA